MKSNSHHHHGGGPNPTARSPELRRKPKPGRPRRTGTLLWTAIALAGSIPAGATGPVNYPAIDGLLKVRSLDVVTEGGAIHALLAGRFSQRPADTLAYVVSHNGGKSWRSPVFVTGQDAAPVLARRGNDARLAVRGRRMVAVWQAQGELPGTGPLHAALSMDGGKTWRPGTNPASGDSTGNQSYPALALDTAGRAHLAWLDDRDEQGDAQGLRYTQSNDGGQHWQPETTLDPKVCTCCWNRLQVLPDRAVAVLYRDTEPHDMRLALRPSESARWRTDGAAVGDFSWRFTGCPHCGGGLAATRTHQGTTLHGLVWTGREAAPGLYYLNSTNAGKTWSAPLRVGDGDSHGGDIAALTASKLALAFTKRTDRGSPVYAMRSRDGGRHWSEPLVLTPPGTEADHPRVVATESGFRVFWTEARPGGGKTWALADFPT